ncbi:MAG TPA: gluconate 2-dehydrogenase subunit 3 family protein [Membranihabitans sp.]|nr:gluconate 2-dehydrogenase subunit 3 family protein [Membranihabitans sp.]
MDRRTAIKRTTIIMGTALSAGTLTGLLAGCTAQKTLDWVPLWLTEDDVQTLTALVDTLLPKTETPSASEVGVPKYIDDIVGNFWNTTDQIDFQQGIARANELAQDHSSRKYEDLPETDQVLVMDMLVREGQQLMTGQNENQKRPFFLQLKELTYSGYFTSEIIGEQVLAYDPVPGEYIGDLPVSEAEKAWSL